LKVQVPAGPVVQGVSECLRGLSGFGFVGCEVPVVSDVWLAGLPDNVELQTVSVITASLPYGQWVAGREEIMSAPGGFSRCSRTWS
jgi:hypothetical protein